VSLNSDDWSRIDLTCSIEISTPKQIGKQQVRIVVQASGNQFLIGLGSALKRSKARSFIRVFKWAGWNWRGATNVVQMAPKCVGWNFQISQMI